MDLSLGLICKCVNGKLSGGSLDLKINCIDTDSRDIRRGSLFIALKGERFDGHDYVMQALHSGAAAAVISNPDLMGGSREQALILVDNTLQALQDLAKYYRQQFDIPVIAVTGSVGKTTVKELLFSCLQSKLRVMKSKGNHNNDIGLPLSLLELREHDEAAVVELAMRGRGEILRLADIARPTMAIISNAEKVHLETMGALENIIEAKCEILSFLKDNDVALINGDNIGLVKAATKYSSRFYTFGFGNDCDFRINKAEIVNGGLDVELKLLKQVEKFYFPLPAKKLAPNVAAAAGAAYLIGIDISGIRRGLSNYHPAGNRLNILRFPEGGYVINDTYNANPTSMAAALETGSELAGGNKLIAVLGDMFELGDAAIEEHLAVGRKSFEVGVDTLVAVGDLARYITKGALQAGMSTANIQYFKEKERSLDFIARVYDKKHTIVFKASRGMRLETLAEGLIGSLNQTL